MGMLHCFCFLLLFFQISDALHIEDIKNYLESNGSVSDALELYIPTVHSSNEKCRNHSIFYLEELKKLTLWATEMFDAAGKMPSGVLYGSSHDLGNFDECVELKVPYKDQDFTGQYCIAKITIQPPKRIEINHKGNYYDFNGYETYYNESVWHTLAAYSVDKTKGPRNILYLTFCLPSSCTSTDLSEVLHEYIELHNAQNEFQLEGEINERSCQTLKETKLEVGDVIFIVFVICSILMVVFSSVYDWLLKSDKFKPYQLDGGLHKTILCFSLLRNYKKLVSTNQNTDGLECLAGMRVFSMFLIIVLHRIMFFFGSPLVNPKYVEQMYTKFEVTLLLNGPILVETFFTISGFLATYLMLNIFRKAKSVNLLVFYLHRFVRMTPAYAVILAFYCTIFVKLGSGPLWRERVELEQERCRASWWANLLYINNYVNTDQICMFQSWYMTCDMNFFLFAPVISWILWKKPKVGLAVIFSLLIASIVTVFAIVYANNLDAIFMLYINVLKDPVSHNTFKELYIPGHMRASSYFVGILTGYIKLYMKENNLKIPPYLVRLGWILCAPIMFASLYIGFVFYLLDVPPLFTALYAALYHFAWSICIAWMIIAISFGYGPWIAPILSWKPVVILSRLTFSVYVSHGIIQIFTAGTIRTPLYASAFNLEYQSAADILLAYCLAFTVSMLYEAPIIALEKVLLSGRSSDGPSKDTSPKLEQESSVEMA